MSRRFNYKEVGENEDWVLFWTDCSVNIERVMDMRRYQVLTFFSGLVIDTGSGLYLMDGGRGP